VEDELDKMEKAKQKASDKKKKLKSMLEDRMK
jgi:hypothetical protein